MGPTSQDLLIAYLERRANGDPIGFELFCAQHPERASELRKLYAGVVQESLRIPRGAFGESFSDAIRSGFGADLDPQISLADSSDGEEADDPSIVETLKSRGPTSGRYRLRGQVARGGMGVVLRVFDRDLRRQLAMKVMLDEHTRRLGRFLEEAQVTGQLDHPGIVPVHELGIDPHGRVFFTMKLVKGETLGEVFQKVKTAQDGWSVTRALSVVLRVCEAMAFAHSKGVVHRDLKPSNIMVGKFGETYVMDWGLAKVLSRDEADAMRMRIEEPLEDRHGVGAIASGATPDTPENTRDGDAIGTPSYMSPEQARGEVKRVGPASDVYAVGAILYHLLTGQAPYVRPGESTSGRRIVERVIEGPPAPVHALADTVPAELEAICETAMTREIEGRYPSMLDLASDLRAYLEQRVVKAYESGAIAEIKKWAQRNKGLAAAAGVVLMVLVGATAVVANKNREVRAKNVEITQQKAEVEARRSESEARRAEAEARKAEFDQLSGVVLLETVRANELSLYPPIPAKVEPMRHWLENDAAKLLAMKPTLLRTVAGLESRALPQSNGEREADRTSHPKLEVLTTKRAEREALASASPSNETAKSLEELDTTIAALEAEIAKRRTWWFADESQRFLHTTLSALLSDLATFEADTVAGVRRRLTWAERIEDLTLHHPNARVTWDEARAALAKADGIVASTLYREMPIDLKPQIGLVPIGMNPVTKLWEFYDLRSACDFKAGEDPAKLEIPTDRDDGSIEMKDGTGIVFVLIPGGTFLQGAQKEDPSAPNFDPAAQVDEVPQWVTLAPYFLARHELTQGQWFRITDGDEPSWYRSGVIYNGEAAIGWRHPVESVSRDDCAQRLSRVGLSIPTEAQWEYGARGGTRTPWWTGSDAATLKGAANVLDQRAEREKSQWGQQQGDFDDGYVSPAPVGAFQANAFGLHDVHGNVWEWSADGFTSPFGAPSPGDGLRTPLMLGPVDRVVRGGSNSADASNARCARRYVVSANLHSSYVGIRPARVFD